MEPFIISGQLAKIEQFPHSVYMLLACVTESWMCGGSILTQDLVLTAAHCFRDCSEDLEVNIYVGSADVRKMPVTRYVPYFMVHPRFNPSNSQNDIAMGRTEKEMPLGDTVKRVIIRREFSCDSPAQVAGWGVYDEGNFLQNERLRWLVQCIRPGGVCSQFKLDPGMLCIENDIENRPARGDSGCALMVNFVQQIGLVSFRHPNIHQLIVYTNVSHYYNWIQRNAQQLSCMYGSLDNDVTTPGNL